MTRYILARAASDRGDDTVVISMEPWPGCRGAFVQRGATRAYLTDAEIRVLRLLAIKGHGTSDEMIDAMYSDRQDGGPDQAYGILRLVILRLRRAVSCIGLTLESRWRQGVWLYG